MPRSSRTVLAVVAAMLILTVGQLAVATFVGGLPQFEGKAFGARLVFYPLMMLSVPAVWALVARIRGIDAPVPWFGVAFIMEPYLVDVTGNTLDLYDSIAWWDDINHLVNWGFLSFGIGVLLRRAHGVPAWATGVMVAGLGAILAILWEVGECTRSSATAPSSTRPTRTRCSTRCSGRPARPSRHSSRSG